MRGKELPFLWKTLSLKCKLYKKKKKLKCIQKKQKEKKLNIIIIKRGHKI